MSFYILVLTFILKHFRVWLISQCNVIVDGIWCHIALGRVHTFDKSKNGCKMSRKRRSDTKSNTVCMIFKKSAITPTFPSKLNFFGLPIKHSLGQVYPIISTGQIIKFTS